jgi:hypothetical protein
MQHPGMGRNCTEFSRLIGQRRMRCGLVAVAALSGNAGSKQSFFEKKDQKTIVG